MSKEGGKFQVCCLGEGVPYHVTYPIMHLMLPNTPEQTDTCENIAFPQLHLRAIITGRNEVVAKVMFLLEFVFLFTVGWGCLPQ